MAKKDYQNFDVYGRPPRTLLPVINSSSQFTYDFKTNEYLEEVPYNFLSITNNSTSYLDVYYDGNYIRVLANETKTIKGTNYSNLKLVTNSVAITAGDVIIVIQKEGIDSDKLARQQALEAKSPLNKILNVVRWIK